MRLRNISLGLALGAGLLVAGCGGGDDQGDGLAVPPPPAAPAVSVSGAAGGAEAPVAAPAAQVPPPDGQAAAGLMPAEAAPLKDDDLLGGNGRPLTEEEKMLINYGVSMFKDEKGRYPANLQEAVASRHITRLPKLPAGEEFSYDPQTGQVTVTKK